MCDTPTKSLETSQLCSLTPVRFLDSPKLKSPSTDANFAASKSRLETIIGALQLNYQKWEAAHKRGLSICTSIEAIKTRCLEADNKALETGDKQCTPYPKELQAYCDKLCIITKMFGDITKSAQDSLRQVRALKKLPGTGNAIFYRSWEITQFEDFLQTLVDSYEKETEVKRFVMKELPHCKTRADLIRGTCAWEYPQYVDGRVAQLFAFLAAEISI